jgi:hypothetical protein
MHIHQIEVGVDGFNQLLHAGIEIVILPQKDPLWRA